MTQTRVEARPRPVLGSEIRPTVRWFFILGPLAGLAVTAAAVATAPADGQGMLIAGSLIAAAAGLSATSTGVFGAVLVPGLLLLGIDPRMAAALSLILQVIVIPLGATSHALVGHVKRGITVPLILGGVTGAIAGAAFASSVPGPVVARLVAFVIVLVGLLVLGSLRTGLASGYVDHEEIHPARIGGVGVVAGFASGISGAGWGPIGVKLLILSRIDPRHAIGSSLVGRIAMAVAAVATYAVSAAASGGIVFDLRLLIVLMAASGGAMLPGTVVLWRLGRSRASAFVAILSIAIALPTLFGGLL
jgi:uncharacterized membrane protein YfcA